MDTNITPATMASVGQDGLGAIIKSQQLWASGMQDIANMVAEMMRARRTQAVAAFKALASVRSLAESMELQSQYTRRLLDSAMEDTGKLTAASIKLSEHSIALITAQMAQAVLAFKPATG